MKEIKVFNNGLKDDFKERLTGVIHGFDTFEGGVGKRNVIKIIPVEGVNLNIKAFKIPNAVNKVVYNFFRKSKAQRSFEYANKLIELEVGTPKPIAYFEYKSLFMFNRSFYVSEQLDCDMTYRELTKDFTIPDYDNILRAFTRFTFHLHQKGIQFLDHSPGNTLIKKNGNTYDFFLVDLNRMKFGPMDFETRIKNFARLTIHKSMVEVMSDEYAKCSGEDYDTIFNLMWHETKAFQEKFHKKKRLKKKLKIKK
ncbi:lipopolysaccharide kinase (Kdo/WaaP) family protein [Mariniflexile fucanivorans]|uniref:Lipopolysaccharide kinase (Kdo/WaaP) family protein n=1 Tax=Mariniflexile fucanivorans TaxID=264023 RepID=A0A4R1RK33_9FLAO|nr:lipopolysaccharide kinase InaA family protein [Mariniflexile fucanivorans]TCL66160.1 lipopolysaccharide kinase (Kdo/WaaP) family protein [Mariniflexile fucanivorans]